MFEFLRQNICIIRAKNLNFDPKLSIEIVTNYMNFDEFLPKYFAKLGNENQTENSRFLRFEFLVNKMEIFEQNWIKQKLAS